MSLFVGIEWEMVYIVITVAATWAVLSIFNFIRSHK